MTIKKIESKASALRSQTALPVIVAPMFLVSNPDMVLAACKQGVIGSFPALNQRTSKGLEQWLQTMNNSLQAMKTAEPDKTIAPYAVNLIVHKTNPRLQADLDLCVQYKVPIIITSLGAVSTLVDKVHSYGGIVLHDVTNVKHAKKAQQAGVDGLIAVAAGAGGHAGTINPVALVSEIRQFFDGIVVLAGCLSNGKDILSAEAMGADFAYMGTRFINTTESSADPDYKKMICDSTSSDIIYTSAVTGVPANFLRQSVEKAGFNMKKTDKDTKPGQLKSLSSEAKAWKTVWSAGQGVSNIENIPTVTELIEALKKEYGTAQRNILEKINRHPSPP